MSVIQAIKVKTSKISSKRQVTLPKSFLDQLLLDPGESIKIVINNGKIEISNPKQALKLKLQKLAGSVKPKTKSRLSLEDQLQEAIDSNYRNKAF